MRSLTDHSRSRSRRGLIIKLPQRPPTDQAAAPDLRPGRTLALIATRGAAYRAQAGWIAAACAVRLTKSLTPTCEALGGGGGGRSAGLAVLAVGSVIIAGVLVQVCEDKRSRQRAGMTVWLAWVTCTGHSPQLLRLTTSGHSGGICVMCGSM